jgi:hypothetical protein
LTDLWHETLEGAHALLDLGFVLVVFASYVAAAALFVIMIVIMTTEGISASCSQAGDMVDGPRLAVHSPPQEAAHQNRVVLDVELENRTHSNALLAQPTEQLPTTRGCAWWKPSKYQMKSPQNQRVVVRCTLIASS